MNEHWADSVAVLKCMEGLDKIQHGVGLSDANVLAYVELLRKDIEEIEYSGPLVSTCDSKLIDVVHRYHLTSGDSSTDVDDVYDLVKGEAMNLLAVCVLGVAVGNWKAAKELCRALHMASLAYGGRVG